MENGKGAGLFVFTLFFVSREIVEPTVMLWEDSGYPVS